jgi:hypothetical protein
MKHPAVEIVTTPAPAGIIQQQIQVLADLYVSNQKRRKEG